MADRYGVPIAAAGWSWDGTASTKWALTSGGAGGQAVPTSSDPVFFDAASGAFTYTVSSTRNCLNLNFTGFTGTFAGSGALNVFGSETLGAGMTSSYTGQKTYSATATGQTITSNGIARVETSFFNGVGGEWTLQDNLTTTGLFSRSAGAVKLNGKTVTCGTITASTANAKSIDFGTNGAIIITDGTTSGTIFQSVANNDAVTGTGTVTLNAATASARTLNGSSMNASGIALVVSAGSGTLTLSGSNTIWKSLDLTGYTGQIQAGNTIAFAGSITLDANCTFASTTTQWQFVGAVGAATLTTNGAAVQRPIAIATTSGTVTLADNLNSNANLVMSSGVFDANNKNVTAARMLGAAGVWTLTMGSGLWTILGPSTIPWQALLGTPTINAGTSTVKFTDSTTPDKDVNLGAFTYNKIWLSGTGIYNLQVNASATVTIAELEIDAALTAKFTETGTYNIGTFTPHGVAGSPVTIGSKIPGTAHNLVKTGGGTVSVDYMVITDSHASPPNTWYAGPHSVNGGGNSGWIFQEETSSMLAFFFMP